MDAHTSTGRRIGAAKSRSGCKTCKIRRVKCDEERPICFRCSSTGRQCEYKGSRALSLALHTPFASTPGYALSFSPNTGQRERRAFEYYFHHVSPHLAGGMGIDFWTGVVPQICRSEPAVWDAMIAISALFEYPNQCLDFHFLSDRRNKAYSLSNVQQDALTWYSRSISSVHSQIQHGRTDPYIVLISCALFICVETIQGRMEEALELYRQGVSLILNLRAQLVHRGVYFEKAALLERNVFPLFLRMGILSLTISGTQPPSELLALFKAGINTGVASVVSARNNIVVLAAETMLFEREATLHLREVGAESAVSAEMVAKKEALRAQLNEWHQGYTNLCQSNSPSSTEPIHLEPMLLIYHAAALICVTGCLRQQETVYDVHFADFSTIVEHSTVILGDSSGPNGVQPPFTFEMNVGVPLAVTVLRCRDPGLRRRALDLMRRAPPIQGFFKSTPLAHLAENLMRLEESYSLASRHGNTMAISRNILDNNDSLGLPVATLQAALIPEEARVHDYSIFRPNDYQPPWITEEEIARFGLGPNQLYLGFSTNQYDVETSTWRPNFQCIPLEGYL
ncbi:uncharacterized protein N7498_002104 [Penicillium cinerascens]|uniref:Zn(2)-C6 fungal-type domain-containing protein n=1 Tax=Penicillium cinerascens TaxID=70096 RepID=A0A9W9N9F0_9EURO|nr:uncharacterized protein N7498_002104 [Penicillium cinerascens]KAJ5215697.1 hypothetical protein N7498_002104 [Penicillium cinerascens]